MKRSLLALSLVALILAACGGSDADPAATIEAYVTAYNAGDIDAVMALFSEESVITGHPFRAEAAGLAAIRGLKAEEFDIKATDNAYTISNVEVASNTVTWDHVWINEDGEQYCYQGQRAVVEDGKILSWTWPGTDSDCP